MSRHRTNEDFKIVYEDGSIRLVTETEINNFTQRWAEVSSVIRIKPSEYVRLLERDLQQANNEVHRLKQLIEKGPQE